MIKDTISRIEARLKDAQISDTEKEGLLKLLEELRGELEGIAANNAEKASSVASFAEIATREGTRGEKDPELLEHATDGLNKSIRSFESEHPELSRIVGQICDFLSGTGI